MQKSQQHQDWWSIDNLEDVDTPALLIFPERAEENIRRMVKMAGGTERLRPHVKTHKLPPLVRMHLEQGMSRFKCATIAEAEVTAQCGAAHVLLAHQPVGPKAGRLAALAAAYPRAAFSTIVDDTGALDSLSAAAASQRITLEVLVDIDCGMQRTGVAPDSRAAELYRRIGKLPGLKPGGLHAYDGHITHTDVAERTAAAKAALAPVFALRDQLRAQSLAVPRLVAGGTPTFPIHAARSDVECSPGTSVLWDAGYAQKLPDLPFVPAALVLTRVVSKPAFNRLCLDLGHKAIASENPHPRVQFLALPEARAVMHSEEHLVLETPQAGNFNVGDCLFGVPWHVCPTVSLHSEAVVVRQGRAQEKWKVTARERQLQF